MLDLNFSIPGTASVGLWDLDELSRRLAETARQWVPQLFPRGRREGHELALADIGGTAPRRSGSCKIGLSGEAAGCWFDHAWGEGGGPLDTVSRGLGLPFGAELYGRAAELAGLSRARANGHGNGAAPAWTKRNGAARSALDHVPDAAFIWERAAPPRGTLAETYLAARGLVLPESEDIRFAPDLADAEAMLGRPAVVLRLRHAASGEATGGIQRIYLKDDGSAHIGHDLKAKRSLGPLGVFMLGRPSRDGVLGIAEGFEKAVGASLIFGLPVWATMGAGNMPAVELPAGLSRLVIFADRGAAGEAAATKLRDAALARGISCGAPLYPRGDDWDSDWRDGLWREEARSQPAAPAGNSASRGASAVEFPDDLDGIVGWFNERYAVVNEAGRAVVYEVARDPLRERRVLVRIEFTDLKKFYQNRMLTVPAGRRSVTKSAAEWWLDSPFRRQYLGGVAFDPTGAAAGDCWNLWSGFAVAPQPGEWERMREHVRSVVCGNDEPSFEYLMNWCARMFQQPQRPGEVAVVLRGEKGSGKGLFCNWLARAWGQHGFHITNPKHLIGNFNAHLRDAVCLYADEAFYAGDKQHESVLKGLVTEPVIPIEGKYQNLVEVPNMLHIVMASNSDWVVPASGRERRYFVLDVADNRIGDRAYFAAIWREMEEGGLAAMIHDFLTRDISGFEVRDVPETEGLRGQKLHTLDSLDRWWLAVLERGFVWKSKFGAADFKQWFEWCSTELLTASYLQWCAQNRVARVLSREMLGKRFTATYGLSTRPSREEIIGEVESLVSANADPVMRKTRAIGYNLNSLEEAAARFLESRGICLP